MSKQSDPLEYIQYLNDKHKKKQVKKKVLPDKEWNKKVKAMLSRFVK